jgi:hypothetical protein
MLAMAVACNCAWPPSIRRMRNIGADDTIKAQDHAR